MAGSEYEGRAAAPIDRRSLLEAGTLGVLASLFGIRGLCAIAAEADPPGAPAALDEREGAELVIRNGLLVTHERSFEADIRVRDGVIREIGPQLRKSVLSREIDAAGHWVLPGGIDPHVHLHIPALYERRLGGRWADDFESGSRAAIAGGITTLGNMTFPRPSEGLVKAVARESELVRESALADVFFHPVVGIPSWGGYLLSFLGRELRTRFERETAELPALARSGQPSIKVFLNFPPIDASAEALPALLRAAARAGVLSLIHCEDPGIIAEASARLRAEGGDSLRHYAASRPVEAEERAVRRAVALCEETGARIYVVHLSSARALRVCKEARERGLPVFVETRPVYLHFTRERLLEQDGQKYVSDPPLRKAEDVEALWRALQEGAIDTVASDHAPWTLEQKLDPSLTLEHHRPGVNNLRVMLPMLFSEGVVRGRLSPQRFVAVTSTNAARLFGLYPHKGTIRVGSQADLVIWDPREERTIRRQDVLSRAGFSIYEGMRVTGWPKLALLRGDVVLRDSEVIGKPGSGRPLSRVLRAVDARGSSGAERGSASRGPRASGVSGACGR